MSGDASPTRFVSGLKLAEQFFEQAVEPILAADFPQVRYSAALVGNGSEVQGFDNPMSTDHHWGPRVMLFVSQAEHAILAPQIRNTLANKLPFVFHGYSTHFEGNLEKGNSQLVPCTVHPINHRVEVFSIEEYLTKLVGISSVAELTPADWLSFPEQKLRALTSGAVFRDDIGLGAVRAKLAYYPHDLWLYILACDWKRIEQESHLMLRAGTAGDELGSAVIAGRLCRDLMHLCFHMEKQYAPYPKWFGTAFSRLRSGALLAPELIQVMAARQWQQRQEPWSKACELAAQLHNDLGITGPLPSKVTPFFGRPFNVLSTGACSETIVASINDPLVKMLAARPLIGNLDIVSDNTDIACETEYFSALRRFYQTEP